MQDLCYLAMTVAVKFVQFKNRSVAEGESVQGALESDAIKRMFQTLVLPTEFALARFALACSVQRGLCSDALAKMHQSGVHGNAMEPCGESRFASEGAKLAEGLDERFLRQIIRIRRIVRHAETNRVDTTTVQLEQAGKRIAIAVDRSFYENTFGVAHEKCG